MHLRLDDKTVLNLPFSVCKVYLHLEAIAAGRDVIHLSLDQFPADKKEKQIRRAFAHLRDCGLSIHFDHNRHVWRIAWPNPVGLQELLEYLKKLQSAQAYFISEDDLLHLRQNFPDADPAAFKNAVESALISAHGSEIKQRNLLRWLRHGVRQALTHEPNSQATGQTQKQDTSESEQEEWQKRVEQAEANRPDLEKLYGKKAAEALMRM